MRHLLGCYTFCGFITSNRRVESEGVALVEILRRPNMRHYSIQHERQSQQSESGALGVRYTVVNAFALIASRFHHRGLGGTATITRRKPYASHEGVVERTAMLPGPSCLPGPQGRKFVLPSIFGGLVPRSETRFRTTCTREDRAYVRFHLGGEVLLQNDRLLSRHDPRVLSISQSPDVLDCKEAAFS